MTDTATILSPLPLDLLKTFCGYAVGSASRYDCAGPFVAGGWCYATNGVVCIRVPAGDHPNTRGNVPPAAALFKKFPKEMNHDWPSPPADDVHRVSIGEHGIDAKYARLIATLPNVRAFVGRNYDKPLPFVFDGGQGVVMGLAY